MTKILIADHHSIAREGINLILKEYSDYDIVAKAKNGNEISYFLQKHEPHVLIMEIDLPQLYGFTFLQSLKTEFPDLKILIYSTHPEEEYAIRSLKFGASGYVRKTASVSTFLDALNIVVEGGIFLNKQVSRTFTNKNVDEGNFIMRIKQLSLSEKRVLNLISYGKPNKYIAKTLNINEEAVNKHKNILLKKLEVENQKDLLKQSKMFKFK